MMRFTTSLLSVSVAIAAVLALPTDISAGNGVAHHARDDGDRAARVQGFDIGFNPSVDWPAVAARGTSFAYILATDSSGEHNQSIFFYFTRLNRIYYPVNVAQPFQAHWTAARYVGLITGAYHVGRPYSSTGADQAAFFLANGGKWTKDGKTLPGALWIECTPDTSVHLHKIYFLDSCSIPGLMLWYDTGPACRVDQRFQQYIQIRNQTVRFSFVLFHHILTMTRNPAVQVR